MAATIEPSSNIPSPAVFTRFADRAPVGDVVPFFDDGVYHIFALTPPFGALYFPERLRTTWRHLRSTDLLHWEQLPDALRPGGPGEPDSDGIWTGSVVRAGGVYQIFYTGHSLERPFPQSVCRATSTDCVNWVKDPANPVSVPDLARFEAKDWRDPFVFWNEVEERYWMLLSTRSAAYPAVSRGVVALQTSTDLASWSAPEELYETFLTHCPECSEVYRHGDKWVMGYSRFTDRRGTVYRFAEDLRGPWRNFATEGPDGSNWYAAKSVLDANGRRIAFGWVPDRNPSPSATTGNWLWAGDLAVPREIGLDGEGQLAASLPQELTVNLRPHALDEADFRTGKWSVVPGGTGATYEVESTGQFAYCVLRPDLGEGQFIVSATVRAGDAAVVGLAVQTTEQLDSGMALLFYPREHRVSAVDLTAARSEIANEYEKATTEYASVAEGAVPRADPDAFRFQVVVRGDLAEAFVADAVTLTYRLATPEPGAVALVVQDGSARFEDVTISYLVVPSRQASLS
jgi:beta-fructofuranosidase